MSEGERAKGFNSSVSVTPEPADSCTPCTRSEVGILSARSSRQARRCGSPTPLSEYNQSQSRASQRPQSAPRTVNGVRTAELIRTTRFEDLSPAEQAAAEASMDAAAAEMVRQQLKAHKIRTWLQRKDKEQENKKLQEMEARRRLSEKRQLEETKKEERQKEAEAQRARRLEAAERRRMLLRIQVQKACEGSEKGDRGQHNQGKSMLTAYAVPRPPLAREVNSQPSKPVQPHSASSRSCRLSLSRDQVVTRAI